MSNTIIDNLLTGMMYVVMSGFIILAVGVMMYIISKAMGLPIRPAVIFTEVTAFLIVSFVVGTIVDG